MMLFKNHPLLLGMVFLYFTYFDRLANIMVKCHQAGNAWCGTYDLDGGALLVASSGEK